MAVYCGSIYDTCLQYTPAETCLPVHHQKGLDWVHQQHLEHRASRRRCQIAFQQHIARLASVWPSGQEHAQVAVPAQD
jgi:hypothetical protein